MAIERERDIKRETDLRNAGVSDEVTRDADRDVRKMDPDRNPDPITGAPGSHPIGTGIGAAGAGAAGVAIGTAVGGPVGSVVGGAIGAVAGGLAGKGVAEAIDPTTEDAYWRDNYSSRPYVREGAMYDDYQPAYQYGWESRRAHVDKSFDEAEPFLARDWEVRRGSCPLNWDEARVAARDAWDRCDTCYGTVANQSNANQANPGADRVL